MRSMFIRCLLVVACCGMQARAAEPIAPKERTVLFNGKDLSGFTTWMKGTGKEDPKQAFKVEEGMIHVSGEGDGYLATKESYRDYHLSLEYKWGKRADGSGNVRNSGVLLNCIEPDGAAGAWPTCIECQLAQGCEGDLIVIRGKDAEGKAYPATITCETTIASDKNTRWLAGGTKKVYSGRQFWWSKHEPGFQEKLDTRGKEDVASPVGEWTRVEVIHTGGRMTIKINGIAVNECFDMNPAAGRIALQNEQNEIWFRNVVIEPAK